MECREVFLPADGRNSPAAPVKRAPSATMTSGVKSMPKEGEGVHDQDS